MIHYEFTNETIEVDGHLLHGIKAVEALPQHNVKKGDLGGFIEKEENLQDNAWVFRGAQVYGYASVKGNAEVFGDAKVYGHASVGGKTKVYGKAKVYGNSMLAGSAQVLGSSQVYGYTEVFDSAHVSGDARVFGNAMVAGNAQVYGKVKVYGNAYVTGNAHVYGDAKVGGSAHVTGEAQIQGKAHLSTTEDYIVFKNWWSSGRYFTWTRSNNKWKVGCFYGTGTGLVKKAYEDSEESGKRYKEIVDYVEHCVINREENRTTERD